MDATVVLGVFGACFAALLVAYIAYEMYGALMRRNHRAKIIAAYQERCADAWEQARCGWGFPKGFNPETGLFEE